VSFNPFPTAAPDFTDPLGLLRACHGRIAGHCETLRKLVPHLATHGADAEAREAMARIHRYFSTAAPHHHEDEEHDLFPLLRGRDADLDGLIAELGREHRTLAGHWADLKPLLVQPERAVAEPRHTAEVIARFVAAYLAHAEKENEHLLPRAAQLITAAEQQELGAAMAKRRGGPHGGTEPKPTTIK